MSRGTKPVLTDSFEASGDLSSHDAKFVVLDASDQLELCNAVGEQCLGVLLDKPAAAGRTGNVALEGIYPVKYGGTVDAGQYITTDASGLAVLATLGDYIHGKCLEDAATGETLSTYLTPNLRKLALGTPTFVIGAEASNTINVAVQFTDEMGNAVDQAVNALISLHDDAAGQTVGTAHSSSPAIGTDGLLATIVASLSFMATSEADGDLDIDFLDTGTGTVYLKVIGPDGTQTMSGAITHA